MQGACGDCSSTRRAARSLQRPLSDYLCPWTRQVSLPAGRRRLARTFRSANSRLSKPAPRTHPIRSLCEEVGACGGRIFFASGVAWTHAGRKLGIVTITRVASAVARELAARIFFHDRTTRQWRDFFLCCRAVATGVPYYQLWHAASEPCQGAHLHLPK